MINYNILADSIDFYTRAGFKRIESPWTVTKEVASLTTPKDGTYFTIKEKNKVLVASGEQSFLYLLTKGFLSPGSYQTITPCFRDEPFDPTHTKYFLKNELIITDKVDNSELDIVVCVARNFFRKYCLAPRENDGYIFNADEKDDVKVIKHHRSFDLEYRGIELGSYGIRKNGHLKWIYGTGVAEPRLTRVLQTYGIPPAKN